MKGIFTKTGGNANGNSSLGGQCLRTVYPRWAPDNIMECPVNPHIAPKVKVVMPFFEY